jgi:hypothetical protein
MSITKCGLLDCDCSGVIVLKNITDAEGKDLAFVDALTPIVGKTVQEEYGLQTMLESGRLAPITWHLARTEFPSIGKIDVNYYRRIFGVPSDAKEFVGGRMLDTEDLPWKRMKLEMGPYNADGLLPLSAKLERWGWGTVTYSRKTHPCLIVADVDTESFAEMQSAMYRIFSWFGGHGYRSLTFTASMTPFHFHVIIRTGRKFTSDANYWFAAAAIPHADPRHLTVNAIRNEGRLFEHRFANPIFRHLVIDDTYQTFHGPAFDAELAAHE